MKKTETEKHQHNWVREKGYWALVSAEKTGIYVNTNATVNLPVEVHICKDCEEVKLIAVGKRFRNTPEPLR